MPRPLSQTARADMLQAARELMFAGGFEACSVEEISRRSGVAKTTLYRHFGGLDDLLLSAVDGLVEQIETPDLGSLRADLTAILDGFRSIVGHDAFRRVFASMLDRAVSNPDFREAYSRTHESRHRLLRLAIRRGIARGEVDPEIDIDTAMYFVQGPFIAKRLIENSELTDSDVDTYLDLVTKALRPAVDDGDRT